MIANIRQNVSFVHWMVKIAHLLMKEEKLTLT
jgi:hypothetical protein